MTRSISVSLRLSPEQHFFYQQAASYHGLSLSTYLRQVLEQSDSLAYQSSHLQHLISQLSPSQTKGNNPSPSSSSTTQHPSPLRSQHDVILLEMLLILRTLTNPDKLAMIRHELNRLGHAYWSPDSQSGEDRHET